MARHNVDEAIKGHLIYFFPIHIHCSTQILHSIYWCAMVVSDATHFRWGPPRVLWERDRERLLARESGRFPPHCWGAFDATWGRVLSCRNNVLGSAYTSGQMTVKQTWFKYCSVVKLPAICTKAVRCPNMMCLQTICLRVGAVWCFTIWVVKWRRPENRYTCPTLSFVPKKKRDSLCEQCLMSLVVPVVGRAYNRTPMAVCRSRSPTVRKLLRIVCVVTNAHFDGVSCLRISRNVTNGPRQAFWRICWSVCTCHCCVPVRSIPSSVCSQMVKYPSWYTTLEGTYVALNTCDNCARWQNRVRAFTVFGLVLYTLTVGIQITDAFESFLSLIVSLLQIDRW